MDEVYFAPPGGTGGDSEGIRGEERPGEEETQASREGNGNAFHLPRQSPTGFLREAFGTGRKRTWEKGVALEGRDSKLDRPPAPGTREFDLLYPKWRRDRSPKTVKNILASLKALGIKSGNIPKEFKDKVVGKSRKGPLGALTVRNHSGLVRNTASKTVKRFEENVGGRDEVVEKLSAIEDSLPQHLKDALFILRANPKKSLSMALVDAKSEPVSMMKHFARACVELAQVEVAVEAHRNLPAVIKELYKHALHGVEDVCKMCGGTGRVKKRNSDMKDDLECTWCKGQGMALRDSPHKEFAVEKLLEVTKMAEKGGPSINLTTNVGVKVESGGQAFFEKVIKASDEVLFKRQPLEISEKSSEEILEAEVVSPKGD